MQWARWLIAVFLPGSPWLLSLMSSSLCNCFYIQTSDAHHNCKTRAVASVINVRATLTPIIRTSRLVVASTPNWCASVINKQTILLSRLPTGCHFLSPAHTQTIQFRGPKHLWLCVCVSHQQSFNRCQLEQAWEWRQQQPRWRQWGPEREAGILNRAFNET